MLRNKDSENIPQYRYSLSKTSIQLIFRVQITAKTNWELSELASEFGCSTNLTDLKCGIIVKFTTMKNSALLLITVCTYKIAQIIPELDSNKTDTLDIRSLIF